MDLIFKKPAQNKQSPNLVTLTAEWKIPFKLEDNGHRCVFSKIKV
jgi:hypothetical protein